MTIQVPTSSQPVRLWRATFWDRDTLVGVGILLSIIFTRMGILDAPSAYLGTSPGAMTVLIVLALESGSSATLVVCFHFFRVVFVILTAPLFLKFFSR